MIFVLDEVAEFSFCFLSGLVPVVRKNTVVAIGRIETSTVGLIEAFAEVSLVFGHIFSKGPRCSFRQGGASDYVEL